MKYITVAILIAAMAFALSGCGERNLEQTKPTIVANPAEKRKSETKLPAQPPVPPTQPTAPAAAPKPDAKGWVTLPGGLKYKDKKVGTGVAAAKGNTVTVHYKGWLDNGTVFDTSRKPGREPFSLTLGEGRVIPGWEQGIPGMKKGGIRELQIPSDLGYGDAGSPPNIPGGATLHFDVEMLKIESAGE